MRNRIVCVFFAACVAVVNAKTCTWTGAADGCWTNRANWAENEVPGQYYAPNGSLAGVTGDTAVFGDGLSGRRVTTIDFDGVYSIGVLITRGAVRYAYGTSTDQYVPIEPSGGFWAAESAETPAAIVVGKLQLGVDCLDTGWGKEEVQIWNNSTEVFVLSQWGFRTRSATTSGTSGETATGLYGTGDIRIDGPYTPGAANQYTWMNVKQEGGKLTVNTQLKLRMFTVSYVSGNQPTRRVEITDGNWIEPSAASNFINVQMPTEITGAGTLYLRVWKDSKGVHNYSGFTVSSMGRLLIEAALGMNTNLTADELDADRTRLKWSSGTGTFTMRGRSDFDGEVDFTKETPTIVVSKMGSAADDIAGSLGKVDFRLGAGTTLRQDGLGEVTDRKIILENDSDITFEYAGAGAFTLASPIMLATGAAAATLTLKNLSSDWATLSGAVDEGVLLKLKGGEWAFDTTRHYDALTFSSDTTVYVYDGVVLTIGDLTNEGHDVSFVIAGSTAEVRAERVAASAGSSFMLNGCPARFDSDGKLVYGEGIVDTVWKMSADGLWTESGNWINGVPTTERATKIIAPGGDYTVKLDGAAEISDLTLANAFGMATLLVTNASLTVAADGRTVVERGGCLAMGGTASFAGSESSKGAPLVIKNGGEVRTTGGTLTLGVSASPTRALDMQGGHCELTDSRLVYAVDLDVTKASTVKNTFGSGTLRLNGNSKLVFDSSADQSGGTVFQHTRHRTLQPNAAGEEARLEFAGTSGTEAVNGSNATLWQMVVGGEYGLASLVYDAGWTGSETLGTQTFIGYQKGVGELVVRGGVVKVGACTFGIGTPGSDTTDDTVCQVTGVVEVCAGASVEYSGRGGANLATQKSYYGGTSSYNRAPGLMIGHGIASTRTDATFRGEVKLAGTLKNTYASCFIGSGPCGDGEVVQTSGLFSTQDTSDSLLTNEVAIGIFGGKGAYRMSAGDFKTRKNVFVGGASCDDIHRDLANRAHLEQYHDARGLVEVSGGTFKTTSGIVLGKDGTGVLALSSTGIVQAASITVVCTDGQPPSKLTFTCDEEGRFGQIDRATRLSFGPGAKIVVDAERCPDDGRIRKVFSLDNDIDGFANIQNAIELVNAPADCRLTWSADGRTLRYGVPKGLVLIVR